MGDEGAEDETETRCWIKASGAENIAFHELESPMGADLGLELGDVSEES